MGRTQALKKQEALKKIEETLSTMPETKFDSAGMVREDRDTN